MWFVTDVLGVLLQIHHNIDMQPTAIMLLPCTTLLPLHHHCLTGTSSCMVGDTCWPQMQLQNQRSSALQHGYGAGTP
jgi:hypothetical protein